MKVDSRLIRIALLASLGWCSTLSARPAQEPVTAPPPTPTMERAAADFAGAWSTSFGPLELVRSGDRFEGTYTGGSSLSGALVDGRLVFRYVEPNAAGEGWFELSEDGASFDGRWREDGTERWSSWKGERIIPPTPTFDGLWDTSFGRLRLQQDGDQASGIYSFASGSRVTGSVEGRRLAFEYSEPETHGEGWFELAEDGQSFAGEWRPEGTTAFQPWTGTRILPEPGRVWLVILEAHWESSIAEQEYAFGDMLRSYFTMASARHVQVRQRAFHDEQDFRRFAGECAYLAEPVMLLISTHGTPEGISVAGQTIGAAAIADSLQDVTNLELLHLSGCSMMNGPVPGLILDGIDPDRRFPVSGYSTPVAWDASALADFTFLTFLLIRRQPPDEAVRQAHLAAPFTGSSSLPGSQFRALGLEVLIPGDA